MRKFNIERERFYVLTVQFRLGWNNKKIIKNNQKNMKYMKYINIQLIFIILNFLFLKKKEYKIFGNEDNIN